MATSADPKIPTTTIRLDRERVLRLDLDAMDEAEQITGYNFLSGGLAGMNIRTLRALVWASLRRDDPALTLERVGELVTIGNLDEVCEVVLRAYVAAMPEPKGGNGGAPPAGPEPRARRRAGAAKRRT
jgi:hypothetical protein